MDVHANGGSAPAHVVTRGFERVDADQPGPRRPREEAGQEVDRTWSRCRSGAEEHSAAEEALALFEMTC